jgi:hypothetical protein
MNNDIPRKSRKSLRTDRSMYLKELYGEPVHSDDADHIFIAAEENFDAAIPMILAELSKGGSKNRRESCVFLLDCYADPRFADDVLQALQRENSRNRKVDDYIFVNAFLTFGEPMLEPLLEIWKDSKSDAYSRHIAREFLGRFLSKPLV